MRFMVCHTLAPNTSPEDAQHNQRLTQRDKRVRGYRSFISLSDGKAVCIYDAPDQAALEAWLQSSDLPYEAIHEVEFEGDRGELHEVGIPAHQGYSGP